MSAPHPPPPPPPQGYSIHEAMTVTSDHDSLVLQPGIPNAVDFGKVHINDVAVKTITLSNSGRYNFDFKWAPMPSRFLSIRPEIGSVAKGEKCTMELVFQPTTECALDHVKAQCKITNGHQFLLSVTGQGSQPSLHFSFRSYDFGCCFLKTAKPYQAVLTVANRDDQDISFDVPWENKACAAPPPPTKGMEREGVVRGRWAPRPMEGKAKGREREGERDG